MTGRELKRIRHRLGLTQVEMAKRLGLHPNTLARQERGEIGISVPVGRLAQVFYQSARGSKGSQRRRT